MSTTNKQVASMSIDLDNNILAISAFLDRMTHPHKLQPVTKEQALEHLDALLKQNGCTSNKICVCLTLRKVHEAGDISLEISFKELGQ